MDNSWIILVLQPHLTTVAFNYQLLDRHSLFLLLGTGYLRVPTSARPRLSAPAGTIKTQLRMLRHWIGSDKLKASLDRYVRQSIER
jgi:hypothetical protein